MIGTELVTPREYAKKKMFGQFAEQAKSSTVPVEVIPAQRKVQERHLPYGLDSVSADAVQACTADGSWRYGTRSRCPP
jgi:hypothetical protein